MKYAYSNYLVKMASERYHGSVFLVMWCYPRVESPPITFVDDVVDRIFFIEQTVVKYQSS